MDENTLRKIEHENMKGMYAHAIDAMKDKAWKISQTGKKAEREHVAIELTENLDALCVDIMNMLDNIYELSENIDNDNDK